MNFFFFNIFLDEEIYCKLKINRIIKYCKLGDEEIVDYINKCRDEIGDFMNIVF